VNNAALFFSDLLEKSGTYVTADFLELSCRDDTETSTTLSRFAGDEEDTDQSQIEGQFDRIVLDPPFGGRPSDRVLDYIDEGKGVKLHEAFLSLALDRLAEGGRLVAIVPTNSLVSNRSAWLRQKIIRDFDLYGIIELSDAKLFPYLHPKFSLSIIVVDNHGGPTLEFTGIVCDDGSSDELGQAVAQVKNSEGEAIPVKGVSESLMPSELLGMEEAQQALYDRFDQVVPLEKAATRIDGGVRRSSEELQPYEDQSTDVHYLKLGADLYEWTTYADDDTPIANSKDVLIALKGMPGKVYHPQQSVIPSSNWAIVRFGSESQATVYAAYLASQIGQQQVQSMARGSTIQYIPLRQIGDVIVPLYSDSKLAEVEKEVHRRWEEHNKEQGDYTPINFEGVF
jgi:hypothetical protein